MGGKAKSIKANDVGVYYSGTYWNDYPVVRAEMNRRISGKAHEWHQHFQSTFAGRKFKKALIINCGNGWVERELYKKGLFKEAVGVDYSKELLAEAKKEAKSTPLRYYFMDINTAKFPENEFDLVINHAAVHHIAYINKVLRAIAESSTDDSIFANFDYVGPHRNQYPLKQWWAAYRVNNTLPPHLKQDLRYPHLPTMMVNDPSEAIHPELSVKTFKRFFKIKEQKHMGGAIAYLLLTHNDNFQKASAKDVKQWANYIMEKDAEYLKNNPGSSMFDYWVAAPDKQKLKDKAALKKYELEEEAREQKASQTNGLYYRHTLMGKYVSTTK